MPHAIINSLERYLLWDRSWEKTAYLCLKKLLCPIVTLLGLLTLSIPQHFGILSLLLAYQRLTGIVILVVAWLGK
jgi:hypothetical protein